LHSDLRRQIDHDLWFTPVLSEFTCYTDIFFSPGIFGFVYDPTTVGAKHFAAYRFLHGNKIDFSKIIRITGNVS